MRIGEANTRFHNLLNLRGLGIDVPAHAFDRVVQIITNN